MAHSSHILKSMPIIAVLGRNQQYRDNGRSELNANDGRRQRVYDNDAKIIEYLAHYDVFPRDRGTPKHGAAHAALYHFAHFTTGQQPYSNVAHHLLPCDVFNLDEVFTEEELEILRRVDYNVNNGKNIVFLPGFSHAVEVYLLKRGNQTGSEVWRGLSMGEQQGHEESWRQQSLRYCNVHRLPCHFDFHRDYSGKVKKDCANLKDLLNSQVGKVCEDWKPPDSIPEELINLQNKYWNYVVAFGESRPLGAGASINELIQIKDPRPRRSPRPPQ